MSKLARADRALQRARRGHTVANTFLATLEQPARHHADWIRPVGEWRPDSPKPHLQFASLVRERQTGNVYMNLLHQAPTILRAWMDREGLSHAAS